MDSPRYLATVKCVRIYAFKLKAGRNLGWNGDARHWLKRMRTAKHRPTQSISPEAHA
jgi:hypothetical protein